MRSSRACAVRGEAERLGCVTAERHLQIGPGPRIRRAARARCCAERAVLVRRPLAVAVRRARLPGDRQRRLHERAHRRLPELRRRVERVPARHARRPDRAGDAMPDRLQPRLRADVAEQQGRPRSHGRHRSSSTAQPGDFTFVQPTYPGDPNGQDDPDPRAHAGRRAQPGRRARQQPVPAGLRARLLSTNPNKQFDLDGTQCPANKLVITPSTPIPSGATFVVRSTTPAGRACTTTATAHRGLVPEQPAGRRGRFVTTEPVGDEDWMPLNNHPSSKPTYDFYDTVPLGKTAIGNGELVSQLVNPPDANFPGGSTTWHWHSPEPIASYLVENSIGSYDLTVRLASSGIQYYEAQDLAIPKNRAATTRRSWTCRRTSLTSRAAFNGPFPFTTDGVVIGVPNAGFEEEMQTKITFANGSIDLRHAAPREHAPVVGRQRLRGELQPHLLQGGARDARRVLLQRRERAGGRRRVERRVRADASSTSSTSSTRAPTCCGRARPRIRVRTRSSRARRRTSARASRTSRCAGSSGRRTSTPRCSSFRARTGKAASRRRSSSRRSSRSCRRRVPRASAALTEFFTEWWDTVYPPGGGPNRPQITAPGLDGGGFHC